jgi:alpha/beta superfamily hydrolase
VPDVVVEIVRFRAGEHLLEGELAYPEEGRPRGAVVLAGPHPLLGGSRHNNVIRALGDGLARRGLATLRFDYRARGADLARQLAAPGQAPWDEADFALELDAAIRFLHQALGAPLCSRRSLIPAPSASEGTLLTPSLARGAGGVPARALLTGVSPRWRLGLVPNRPAPLPLVLIGYSFGCSLLPGAVRSAAPAALVLIAPALGKHDLEGFVGLSQPKLVLAPHDDFALDERHLPAWFERLGEPKELVRAALDGHFFRGCEDALESIVAAFIDRQWGE